MNEKRAHYAPRNRNLVIIIFILESSLPFLLLFSLIIMLFYTFLSRVASYVGQDGARGIFFGFPRKVDVFACFGRGAAR